MKKKINNNDELLKFKNSSISNIIIYEGKPGCGKSMTVKSEINQLSSMEDLSIYVIDSEKEYGDFSSNNVTIINLGELRQAIESENELNKHREKLFDVLDDIYNKCGKLQVNKKTIVYIEGFSFYCSDKETQLKFLEYALMSKHRNISFVLIVQDLDFMDALIRNMYLLCCNEHYKINRDIKNSDPFWCENSKLTVEEIEKRFPEKIANALKIQKSSREK